MGVQDLTNHVKNHVNALTLPSRPTQLLLNKEINNDPNVETNKGYQRKKILTNMGVITALIPIIFLCLIIDTSFPKVQLANTAILQFYKLNNSVIDCNIQTIWHTRTLCS